MTDDPARPVLSRDLGPARQSWTLRRATSATTATRRLRTALRKCARTTSPQLVKDSELRGRGGAGFPTGMKWGFIPQGGDKPVYLVVNADESEPGTCKDIPLMMANPHELVEGVVIASYAIRATHAFIYVRGEVVHVLRRLQAAVAEAYEAGYARQGHPRAPATTSRSSCTPAPARTSAARRRRCSTRSRAAAASRGCARRSRPIAGLYASPDRHQQRRVDRQRPVDPAQRRRLVPRDGHRGRTTSPTGQARFRSKG